MKVNYVNRMISTFLLGAIAFAFAGEQVAAAQTDGDDAAVYYYSGDQRITLSLALDEFQIAGGASREAPGDAARALLPEGAETRASSLRKSRSLARLRAPLASRAALRDLGEKLAQTGLSLMPTFYPPRAVKRRDTNQRTLTKQLAVRLGPSTTIEALADAYGAQVLSKVDYSPDTYILRTTTGPFAALDAAVAIYENEDVLFASPLFERRFPRRMIPNDPKFAEQWHLLNTGQGGGVVGADINVVDAWDSVTGAGVNIGICDEGMEVTHPDLAANARTDIDYDFWDGDNDPSPESSYELHGTAVGGAAAAVTNNSIGVSGVAPGAGLVSLRLLGGDKQEAEVMNFRVADAQVPANVIAIKNNSWGPSDNGSTVEGPGPLMLAALENATATGRGGLGTIFVWSAGNGGSSHDNVNYDGYASSRYTIAVGATNKYGTRAVYSEPGASLFIMAPGGSMNPDFLTTDLTGAKGNDATDYTVINGTSFSSPVAGAVVALMLEANPDLTWRDAQHILAQTAVKIDPTNSGWFLNGAGFDFNHEYGFGHIDASAAAAAAANWTLVPNEAAPVETALFAVDQAIPDNDSQGLTQSASVEAPSDFVIECVEILFNAQHPSRGDLAIELLSPQGSKAVLAETHNDTNSNYSNWTFHSFVHWGENPAGEWKLTVRDGESENVGVLNSWQLTVHGYRSDTTIPGGPTNLNLAANDDTGASDADNITRQTEALTITGTADPGLTVRLKEDDTLLASSVAETFAEPGIDIDLAPGVHEITATTIDALGTESPASAVLIITVDPTSPTVEITSLAPEPTSTIPIVVTAVFNEAVSGFDTTKIILSNATVSNFIAQSAARYQFDLTPINEGLVTADIPASAVEDRAGNASEAALQFTRNFINRPGPLNVQATDGAYTFKVDISWSPLADATAPYYQVYRALSETEEKTPVSDWQTAARFADTAIDAGTPYYYWVRAADNAQGDNPTNFSDHDTGWAVEQKKPIKTYKITYKKCFIVDNLDIDGRLIFKGATPKSTVKIQIPARGIPSGAPDRLGVSYVALASIPEVYIEGSMKKFSSAAPIEILQCAGVLKNLTTKGGHASEVKALGLGVIKMTALEDASAETPTFASTSITTDGMDDGLIKVKLNGVILTNFFTFQSVKYIKVASKKHTNKTTGRRSLSLGGVGSISRVEAQAWGDDLESTPGNSTVFAWKIGGLSAKGCPIVPDQIDSDVIKIASKGAVYSTASGALIPEANIRIREIITYNDIQSITAKTKKFLGVLHGGFIGSASDYSRMRVYSTNIETIDGAAGVAGIFIAGRDGMEPNYQGYIDKIYSEGQILGEAHVGYPYIRFKPAQGQFQIFTSPPSP